MKSSDQDALQPLPLRVVPSLEVNAAHQMVNDHLRGRRPPSAAAVGVASGARGGVSLRSQQPNVSTGAAGGPSRPPGDAVRTARPGSTTRPTQPTKVQTLAPPRTVAPLSASRGGPGANMAASLASKANPKAFANVRVPAHDAAHDECKNPQCHHCGTVIIPLPQLLFPIQDKPLILVNGWLIYTIKLPILSSAELDALEARFPFPLPEMIFGNTYVRLRHDALGQLIEFNALDALDTMEPTCELKVSYHREWLQARKKMNEDILKPYDWTYLTNYRGTTAIEFAATDAELPIAKLLRPDPILFFDELILFEDELGDNGILMLLTKIRVMPTCLLLLCRLFLRIDDVIFRIRDTRIYIDLDTNHILRETKYQEMDYQLLLDKTTKHSDPKKLLRDPNWVAEHLPVVSTEMEEAQL